MQMITTEEFERWLDAYGVAWKTGDSQAAIDLFADKAQYYETPFDDPFVGRDAIRQYWSEGAGESQKDVQFVYGDVVVLKNKGFAKWQASFIRIPSGNQVELDGFLLAEFTETGKCSVFREWWHRREEEVDATSI